MDTFWVLRYREKSGAWIVANRGRVFSDRASADAEFRGFVMHSGCELVELLECTAVSVATRRNSEGEVCRKCGSDRTEFYGAQLHCFACGAVYRHEVKPTRGE